MGLVNYSLPVQPFRLSNPLCHLTQCQFLMSGVAQPTSLCSLWKQLPCLWRLRDGEKLPLGLNSISYGLPYLGEWVTLLALAGVLRSKSTHAFVNKFNFFPLFIAVPVAYESTQARGQITAAAASLHHSHGNVGFKLDTSQILNPLSHSGNSNKSNFFVGL